ncbi:dynactin subunit 2 [Nilaparvata lugens]|uniref:dynactin subunit 2 n=1 Tax=Nilaparvata lugens TaxID=108931 RepID=UPI00193D61EC|nr:dynactin subunit 2 [Nilaparvata lugens]
MADPKYATLPGIAYDQPDVYETNDLPEADRNTDIYEEESQSIERLHISPTDAFSKFKDKHVSAMKVDFSDRLSKNKKTGYDARSGDWELAGYGNNETVLQKYQRLQCEMKDLMDEINSLKEKAKEDAKNESTPYSNYSNHWRTCGISYHQHEFTANVRQRDYQKVISHLSQLRATSESQPEKSDASKDAVLGSASVHYKLHVQPGQAALASTVRLANLEQRLNKIESVVGTGNSGKLSRLGCDGKSLLEISQSLAARASLLDAQLLDAAEARCQSLNVQMDQIKEKSAAVTGGQPVDEEKEKKIATLYDLAKETSQISKILPQTLDRMAALQSLHQQSADYTQSLTELEAIQARLAATAESNTDLLKKVESTLVDDLANIQANIKSLETRMNSLCVSKK